MERPLALKIVTLLLYGHFDYVRVSDQGIVHLEIGPFARKLRTTNHRMKEYIDWLHDWDYIHDVEHFRGYCTFRVKTPRLIAEIASKETLHGSKIAS